MKLGIVGRTWESRASCGKCYKSHLLSEDIMSVTKLKDLHFLKKKKGIILPKKPGAEKIAQLVKCSLYKDLSLILKARVK